MLYLPPMKTAQRYNRSLWFKRWSRRADASFLSIGKVVHIGHLKADICRLAMLKSGVLGAAGFISQMFEVADANNHEDDALDEPQHTEQQLLLAPVQVTNVKAAAARAISADAPAVYCTQPTSKCKSSLWMWVFSFCNQFKIGKI